MALHQDQDQSERDPLIEKLEAPPKTEGSVIVAALCFVNASCLDALCAVPTHAALDVPSSLRSTCLTLVCVIAAPPIRAQFLGEQRAFAFFCLLAASLFALHEGALWARLSEAAYALLGGWASLFFFSFNPARDQTNAHSRRENTLALAAGFLAYGGARVFRQALQHAPEALRFHAQQDGISAKGLAVADDFSAAVLAFGAVCAISASAIILLNHDAVYSHGSSPVAKCTGQLAGCVFTSALIAQITSSTRAGHLSAVFSASACSGAIDVCEVAYRTRRFFISNSCTAPLWALAVGLTCLSFPADRRCRTRDKFYGTREQSAYEQLSRSSAFVLVLCAVAVSVVAIFYGGENDTILVVELLLLFFSIPTAGLGWAPVAAGLHAAGIVVYVTSRLGSPFGMSMRFLTHWIVSSVLLLSLLLSATTATSWLINLLTACRGPRSAAVRDVVEDITASALTIFVSLCLFLVNASLVLVAAYDGSALSDAQELRHSVLSFIVQHSLSFWFGAALLGGRFEPFTPNLNTKILRWLWFTPPIALSVCWGITLLSTQAETLPYVSTGDPAAMGVALLAAIAPWFAAGVVVC